MMLVDSVTDEGEVIPTVTVHSTATKPTEQVILSEPDEDGIHVASSMSVFDGKSLTGWQPTKFGGDGEVSVKDGQLILEMGVDLTGITWSDKEAKTLPKTNYDITLEAKRVDGNDFFCGLTFPVKDDPCSLILGGWGGSVCGLSSINGMDASENETTSYRTFDKDKWYKIRVRVLDDRIQAWVDGKEIVYVDELDQKKIDVRIEVELSRPLGLATWQTTAAIRNFQIHRLDVSGRKKEDS
ncbi:MAG: hypothetical protein CMJ78_03715 [Planctomycetaceae bacterium]|nr:hypothetical protein [Planctomycetaceae bacterium]